MALIKMNASPLQIKHSEKAIPRKKAVRVSFKFVMDDGDKDIQSTDAKRRRYMRRGSKSASMFQSAAFLVQQEFTMRENKAVGESHKVSTSNLRILPRSDARDKAHLETSLKFCSTKYLLDEERRLEKILRSIQERKLDNCDA